MGINADIFDTCIEFMNKNNIKKLSEIKSLPTETLQNFVERLICNFDSIERDRPEDYENDYYEEEDYGGC